MSQTECLTQIASYPISFKLCLWKLNANLTLKCIDHIAQICKNELCFRTNCLVTKIISVGLMTTQREVQYMRELGAAREKGGD